LARPQSICKNQILMKKVAIIQSNYIPWKGYFDIISRVDEFILLDDVQFTRRDWRNRNQIKTPQGLQWLTIPVDSKGKFNQKISETRVSNPDWGKKHWNAIVTNYSKAAHFKDYGPIFEKLYLDCSKNFLSEINYAFITAICGLLDIKTRISWSAEYPQGSGKGERLLGICRALGAQEYLSGPSAKEYLQEDLFRKNGIALKWMDYSGYLPYRQLFPPFVHNVSVLDLLFNEGPESKKYLRRQDAAV